MTTSMLDTLYAHALEQGWPLESLDRVRMEAPDAGDGGDTDTDTGDGGSESGDTGEGDTGGSDGGDDGSSSGSGSGSSSGRRSLEDYLSSLDDEGRQAVLGEVSKARKEAQGYRQRLRGAEAKASEYDKLVEASRSEQERAVEQARREGRTTTLAEVGQKLAGYRIEAALTGLVPDPEAIVEDLNLARYVDENGDVDVEAVTKLRDKYAALAPQKGPAGMKPNPAQGSSGAQEDPAKGQITSREQLRGLSPETINQLRKEGRLDTLMGRRRARI